MEETYLGKNERKRKLNFSTSEINKITELVEENLQVIRSKFTNSITNKTKDEIWTKMPDKLMQLGWLTAPCTKSRTNGKTCRRRQRRSSRGKEEALDRQGVVHRVKKTKEATEKITRLFGNAPSFTGPHGFETIGKLKYNFWASVGHPRPQAQARAALTVARVQAVEQN